MDTLVDRGVAPLGTTITADFESREIAFTELMDSDIRFRPNDLKHPVGRKVGKCPHNSLGGDQIPSADSSGSHRCRARTKVRQQH
jgi:hypothetical protein